MTPYRIRSQSVSARHRRGPLELVVGDGEAAGVLLEADNFRIHAPPVLVSGQPRPTPEITRDLPAFSLDELRARPYTLLAVTMECAGNGRARLQPLPRSRPEGNQS